MREEHSRLADLTESIETAQLLSGSWYDQKAKEIGSYEPLSREYSALKKVIKNDGITWSNLSKVVSYDDVVVDRSSQMRKLSPTDEWGSSYEFRAMGNLLLVRSPGADKVYDSDFYRAGHTPRPGGGDIVVLLSYVITSPEIPKRRHLPESLYEND